MIKNKMKKLFKKPIAYEEESTALDTVLPHSGCFDENSFDFVLSTSEVHTDVLVASATFKETGMPVPLHCTWYRKSDGDLHEIEGVKVSCY